MSDMRKYLDLLNESVETKTQEKKEPNPLLEGKYGPHSSNLDDAIDSALAALGDDPTIEEIYAQTDPIRKNSDLGGWFSTSDYREKQALGVIAEKLGLPGLYRSKGKGFVYSEKEKEEDGRETGRYKSGNGASDRDVKELAKKGYLTKKQASTLGVAELFGKRLWGKDDSEEYAGTRDANTSAKEQRSMKRKFKRFQELVAKAKDDTKEADESITFESKLVSQIYRSLLREGLNDEEQKELDALADELAKFNFSDEAFGEKVLQAVQDYEDWSDEQMDTKLDKAAQDQADMEKQYDKDNPAESGSLEAFLKSGKKSIENNPEEKKALQELQELYNKLGFDSGKPDGVWGPKTKAATEEFQEFMGLTKDGQPGPNTIGAALKIKDFGNIKEFKTDLDKMVELIGKGGKIYIPKEGGDANAAANLLDKFFPNGVIGDYDQNGAVDVYDLKMQTRNNLPTVKDLSGGKQTSPLTPKTDSIDFRHLMSIVEGKMLFEALSADEQKLLMDLYNKHKDKFDTAPEMFKSSIDTIKGAVTDQDPTATNDTGDKGGEGEEGDDVQGKEQALAQIDNMEADKIADAIYKAGQYGDEIYMTTWTGWGTSDEYMIAVLGTITSTEQFEVIDKIFQRKYGEPVREYVESEFSWELGDTDEKVKNILDKFKPGASDKSDEATIMALAGDMAEAFEFGITTGMTDEQAILEVIAQLKNNDWEAFSAYYSKRYGKPKYDKDLLKELDSELSGLDAKRVNNSLKKFGVSIKGKLEKRTDKVEPRPTESGVQGDYARDAWDKKYAKTHNPDGTLKSTADPVGTGSVDDPAKIGSKVTYKVGDPITAEIQTKLKKLGKDAGMVGEPLTADDVKALNGEGTDPLKVTVDTGAKSPEEVGSDAALSQVKADPKDVGQKVEPRPTESGVQGDYARAAWDKKYSKTHNPDGTPKKTVGMDDGTGAFGDAGIK